jgi:hypothetical protein
MLVGEALWFDEVLLPKWSMARSVVRNCVPMDVKRTRLADAFMTRNK